MKRPGNTYHNVSRLSHKELQSRLEKASTMRPRIRVGEDQPFYREYSSILVSFLFFLPSRGEEERKELESCWFDTWVQGCTYVRVWCFFLAWVSRFFLLLDGGCGPQPGIVVYRGKGGLCNSQSCQQRSRFYFGPIPAIVIPHSSILNPTNKKWHTHLMGLSWLWYDSDLPDILARNPNTLTNATKGAKRARE